MKSIDSDNQSRRRLIEGAGIRRVRAFSSKLTYDSRNFKGLGESDVSLSTIYCVNPVQSLNYYYSIRRNYPPSNLIRSNKSMDHKSLIHE